MGNGIGFSVDAGVARVLLDRPDVGNALDLGVAKSLLDVAVRCETDPSVRCILVTGSGRFFCAGGDVNLLAGAGERRPEVLSELIATFHAAVQRLAFGSKPLVTAVNGPAAGAGFSLAMLGDIVICSRVAHFTAAYGAIGLTSDGGLSWMLPRLVGLRNAQDIMLTNRRIAADEAAAMGLVTRAVDPGELEADAQRTARSLANGPARALAATRKLLNEAFAVGFAEQLDRELRSMVAAGPESAEGLAAFVEKRQPDFRREFWLL